MTVVTQLKKLKIQSFLKWVSLNRTENSFRPSKSSIWATVPYHSAQNPRLYRTKGALKLENLNEIPYNIRLEAQTALLEYLHSTRGLPYVDAQHISQNSPRFLEMLLKEVQTNENNVERSLARFFCYNPINEFEPFYESIGLEDSSYLPPNMIYLMDDRVFLDNYQVLCAYGVARNKIGKIYKEANEVFRYNYGVLDSRMQSLIEGGFDRSSVPKIVSLFPYLLLRDSVRYLSFFKVVEKLKSLGISLEWIVKQLCEEGSYSWHHMLELLCLFSELDFCNEHLGGLLRQHPEILFKDAESTTIPLIGFLLKFGASTDDIVSMFQQLPRIQFHKFVLNLKKCYLLFVEIEMEFQDIAKLVCAYPVLLGSCSIRKASYLLNVLNTGKRRLCEIIRENPQELKNWVIGSKVKPLPPSLEEDLLLKNKFLLDMGYVENSDEMNRALQIFDGRGRQLQERFDCFVNAGFNPKDIKKMLIGAPQIITQAKELIEMKINCLLSLGYPVSSMVACPSVLGNTIQRIRLRVSMYNWLKQEGAVPDNLSLSTIIARSDKKFISLRVNGHPKGPEVWEKLKKQIYNE